MLLAATAATTSQGGITQLVFPVLIAVGAYLVFIRPRSQQAKRAKSQALDISVGDRVIMTSGILGRITRLTDDSALVEVAPDVEISFIRRAISRRIDDSDVLAHTEDQDGSQDNEVENTALGSPEIDGPEPDKDGEGGTHPSA